MPFAGENRSRLRPARLSSASENLIMTRGKARDWSFSSPPVTEIILGPGLPSELLSSSLGLSPGDGRITDQVLISAKISRW